MNILIGFLLTLHVIVSVLLILIVLIQRPRSEGLGTAFGGGVTDTLFGSGAGNVLTKITTYLGILFFTLTLSLAYLYSHRVNNAKLADRLKASAAAAAPAVTNAPVAPPSAPSVPPETPLPPQNEPQSSTKPSPLPSAPPAPAKK